MTILAHSIIHKSSNKSNWFRVRDLVLCTTLWVVYYILMQDFFRFVGTIMAWELYGEVRPGLPAAFRILATMQSYALVILALGSLLIGWAIYNKARFSGRDRRKSAPVVTVNDLGDFYNLNPEDIDSWRQSRILTMHHDRHGNLVGVSVNVQKQDHDKKLAIVAA